MCERDNKIPEDSEALEISSKIGMIEFPECLLLFTYRGSVYHPSTPPSKYPMKIQATFTLGKSTYTTQLEVDPRLMNQDSIRMSIALLIAQKIELHGVSAVEDHAQSLKTTKLPAIATF